MSTKQLSDIRHLKKPNFSAKFYFEITKFPKSITREKIMEFECGFLPLIEKCLYYHKTTLFLGKSRISKKTNLSHLREMAHIFMIVY